MTIIKDKVGRQSCSEVCGGKIHCLVLSFAPLSHILDLLHQSLLAQIALVHLQVQNDISLVATK